MDYQAVIDRYYPCGQAGSEQAKLRDIYMRHCASVANLALYLARRGALPLAEEEVMAAGMLHDIGIVMTDAPGIHCHGDAPYLAHGGLGAQLLAELPRYETGAEAILIESECPDKAEDEAMAVRRLGFYARCGARDTGFTEHLFDAWFRILVLDCPGAGTFADRQAVDALVDCYRRTISENEWQKYVQFYCPDGTKYC